MTLMVRDEADVVAPMVEHHLAQGVDLIIATDNGSVDGTREILAEYAAAGVLELHDDPRHAKQQAEVVTGMARRAFTEHGADWVINADADEFWVPVDRTLRLREALERTPKDLGSFSVPVVNLTGTPARRGTGVRRLTWRDERPGEGLMEAAGLHAQPTGDAVHVGSADVVVAQGNHFVNIESHGSPDPAVALEVLHLPWRSLDQHAAKVEMSGRAYDANPDLRPSPNHHGMRDYRRLLAGYVEEFYLYRHPVDPVAEPGFVHDDLLVTELERLADAAVRPDLLAAALDDRLDDPYTPAEVAASAAVARTIIPMEAVQLAVAEQARADRLQARKEAKAAAKQAARDLRAVERQRDQARAELQQVLSSKAFRVGTLLAAPVRRGRRGHRGSGT